MFILTKISDGSTIIIEKLPFQKISFLDIFSNSEDSDEENNVDKDKQVKQIHGKGNAKNLRIISWN